MLELDQDICLVDFLTLEYNVLRVAAIDLDSKLSKALNEIQHNINKILL